VPKLIVGLTLIIIAFATQHYAEPWFRTAGVRPVYRPVSLVPGHLSAEFLAGYSARYRVGIAFENPQELPFTKPICTPAPNFPPDDCSEIPSHLLASWRLSSGAQTVRQGSASEKITRVSDGPFLWFGGFDLQGGRRYKLDVDLLERCQPVCERPASALPSRISGRVCRDHRSSCAVHPDLLCAVRRDGAEPSPCRVFAKARAHSLSIAGNCS
jgi:hypothetical protein